MKKIFPGYYKYTKDEVKKIWNNCFFVFDTSVLLSMYSCTKESNRSFLDILEKIKDKIKIPYHVALEYHNNLFNVIKQTKIDPVSRQVNNLDNSIDFINKNKNTLNIDPSDISNLKKITEKIKSYLCEHKSFDCKEKNKLSEVLSESVLPEKTEEQLKKIEEEAKIRYDKKIPPGYKDNNKKNNNKYGDYIIWKNIIELAKAKRKNIVFITEDKKTDWFVEDSVPQPYLINEFIFKTKKKICIYTIKEFIQNYSEVFKDSNLSKLAKELQEPINIIEDTEQYQNDYDEDNNDEESVG